MGTTRVFRKTELPGVEIVVVQDVPAPRVVYSDAYVVCAVHSCAESPVRYRRRGDVIHTGQLLLMDPGEMGVMLRPSGPVVAQMFFFAPDLLRDVAVQQGIASSQVYFDRLIVPNQAGATTFARLHAALASPRWSLSSEEAWVSTLSELVGRHMSRGRTDAASASCERRCLQRVRDLLEDRLADNVSLSELAEVARLNKFHLLRCFKATYGLPPAAYQRGARVSKERKLLLQGLPGADVATTCGFSDQSHMGCVFRQFLGVTPGEYAKGAARCQRPSEADRSGA
jgi:AraC-like DNA-binding protein